jgi:hypothetical protein
MKSEAQKHADQVPDPDPQHWLIYKILWSILSGGLTWPHFLYFLYKYLLCPLRTAAASSSPEAEPAVKKTRRQISRAIFGDSSQDEEGEEEEMEQTDSVQILGTEPLQKVTSLEFFLIITDLLSAKLKGLMSKFLRGYKTNISTQCCGSGMFIPDPDFYPSRIPDSDPGSRTRIPDQKTAAKERGEKKLVVNFFCSHNFHIIENCFILEMANLGQFSKNYRTFLLKN